MQVNGSWKIAGPRALLVDRFSATYPRPWDTESFHEGFSRTHSDLVKFTPEDIDYLRVLSVLREITLKAAPLIVSRFLSQGSKKHLLSALQSVLQDSNRPLTDV